MTTFTQEEIEKIAHLARLSITHEEARGYASSLSNIISLVEKMSPVDTTSILPLFNSLDATQRLRPDVPSAPASLEQRTEHQEIAPKTAAGLYLVPSVLE